MRKGLLVIVKLHVDLTFFSLRNHELLSDIFHSFILLRHVDFSNPHDAWSTSITFSPVAFKESNADFKENCIENDDQSCLECVYIFL